MNRALLLSAVTPALLRETLASWSDVRDLDAWPLHIQIDPTSHVDEVIEVIRAAGLPGTRVTVNPRVLGHQRSMDVGLNRLFLHRRYDFVYGIRDDVVVAPDILEYLAWASNYFQYHPLVQAVQAGGTYNHPTPPSGIVLDRERLPGNWGTWRYWWLHERTEGHLTSHPAAARERLLLDQQEHFTEWPSAFDAPLAVA
jgi:hypothetical protein